MPAPAVSADAKLFSQRFIKTILLVVLFCFTYIHAAWATNPLYTITQNTELNFCTAQIPGGSSTDIISTAGAQNGSVIYLYGGYSEGDFTIKCTGTLCTNTMNLSITSGTGCTGLTGLSAWQGNYNNGAKTGALPFSGLAALGNGGTADFKVGATATYTSSAPAGTCTPTFTIGITDSGSGSGNFSENASIGFDVGLALTKNADINFGTVNALNASTYRISTAGTVSTVSGTGIHLYGATAAGNITIAGSATDGINISVGYTANNGVTPSNAQCSYNGGAAAFCNGNALAPGSGKALVVGVDVTTDGTQAAGTTATPSLTIFVFYN